jgi:hypothetical protein
MFFHTLVIGAAERQLLQVIHALAPSGGLACRLHGRQQQRHQYANDGNHYQ